MCTFAMNLTKALFDITTTVTREVNAQNAAKKNNEYRVQLALNNANLAKNEGLRQQQMGIDKSRLEKINAIQVANLQKAKSSASGFDINSATSDIAYQDVLDMSYNEANNLKNEYDTRAFDYFEQANNYLNQAHAYNKQYNESIFSNALNALGKTAKVSSQWFSIGEKKEPDYENNF